MKITMTRDKDCKHSVRFATGDDKAPVSNVYVNRFFPGINEAKTIQVEITLLNTPTTHPAVSNADLAQLVGK